jgi:hypothetical protein
MLFIIFFSMQLSDDTINKCAKQVISDFVNLITDGISGKDMDVYNVTTNAKQLISTMGSAFFTRLYV